MAGNHCNYCSFGVLLMADNKYLNGWGKMESGITSIYLGGNCHSRRTCHTVEYKQDLKVHDNQCEVTEQTREKQLFPCVCYYVELSFPT